MDNAAMTTTTTKSTHTTINQKREEPLHRTNETPTSNMSNDDDEVPVFYADARDGLLTSAADNQRKALKHFNYFLVGYCKQIGIGVVRGEDIP